MLSAVFIIKNSYAQKGKITDAQLSLQDGKVMDAKKSIDAAFADTNALRMVSAWTTKAEVYKSIYESKIYYAQNPTCLFTSKDAYLKAYELETKPKKQKEIVTPLTNVNGYLFNEGFERFNNKKYDDAYKHFEASRVINEFLFSKGLAASLDTNAIFATAIAGSNSGESATIIPLFEKLVSMNYDNVAVYETLAQLYEKQNNKEALSKVVAKGLEKFPSSKNLLIYDLNSSIDGGDIQKSIDKLEKASANDPKNSSIILNLGLQYEKANNVDKAKECYEKAISINPNLSEAYFNLGVMYIKGDAELVKKLNAEDDMKKYEALKKQRDEIFQKALPNFEKAYALDPKNADYKQTLKKIYASMNLLDKAAALGE